VAEELEAHVDERNKDKREHLSFSLKQDGHYPDYVLCDFNFFVFSGFLNRKLKAYQLLNSFRLW
jgi:hypothetical protein